MDAASRLNRAREILAVEEAGLARVREGLDDRFAAAIDLLQARSGKIVVIGMGKSGIVGRKLAATLTSTGSPAVFLHPAEGLHGDLGIVQQGDVAIVISYSGTSSEIVEILTALRRLMVPVIGLSSDPASPLGTNADVLLNVAVDQEACPMGLAPTASTTAALAVGDALAVVLLEEAGFTPQDFGFLHPGGALGRRLRRVSELMHVGDEIPLVRTDTLLPDALMEMTGKRLGITGVEDPDGRLVGVITDGDVRRFLGAGGAWQSETAAAAMSTAPKTIAADALVESALARMEKHSITSLFVTDPNGAIAGVLHLHDLLREKVR